MNTGVCARNGKLKEILLHNVYNHSGVAEKLLFTLLAHLPL